MAGLLDGLRTPAPKRGAQTTPPPIRTPGAAPMPKQGGARPPSSGGGLLSGLRQPQAPARGAPGPAAGGEKAKANVTPEKQAAYDQFVNNGYKMIYSDSGFPAVLGRLKDGDPVEALANTAMTVVFGLEQSASQKGAKIDGDVMLHGGAELLGDLANLSKEAGGHAFSQEEVESAFFQALDLYKLMKDGSGGLDPAPFKQDLARLQQMDATGQLAQLMPDTVQRFAGGGAPAGQGAR